MGLWEHLFGESHKHTKNEKRLIEIIDRMERHSEEQDKIIRVQNRRIDILEEHLWKCRHQQPPAHGVRLDVVF